ncbi:recombinase [Sulfuriferula plumbiphila]|uniref:Recombinase n=1 Tax=Sulfuriferula plumbiphila TaxID=171865 RepID=A0A512L588_9PROT|nr:site-specific recombinase [Sulfuriferula plumbiphila]BBP05864.1 recombinase [Sulfuriferula plumbiphila]GEP29634.1 recombinase [Sulfuriferula plumbiphila]
MDYTAPYLERTLKRMAAETGAADPTLIKRLIFHLRPGTSEPSERAATHLADLLGLIERNAGYAQALRFHLLGLLLAKKSANLLRDSGILPRRGVGTELSRRIGFKLLPPVADPDSLRDWLDETLTPRDTEWIAAVDIQLWYRLLYALNLDTLDDSSAAALRQMLLDAINGLSHRIAAEGLDPELLRIEPTLEEYASPFLAQHEEIYALLQLSLAVNPGPLDIGHAMVLLDQCEAVLERIQRRAVSVGTSVNLTLLSNRLHQQIARISRLLELLQADSIAARVPILTTLFLAFSATTNERYSVRNLVSATTGRLAYQITQHAGRTGQHYIADSRSELMGMFRSAAGAGIIVAAMALLKVLIIKSHLAPLQEALLVSLNYALGFLLVFVLNFTIATKQPAMTASLIAHTIARARSTKDQDQVLSSFVTSVYTSQSAAIAGNLLLAFITAALIGSGLAYFFGVQPVDAHKAERLLSEVSPAAPMNLVYAGVAGAGLFLSGIVSGYYDNKSVYNRIPERLACLSWPPYLVTRRGWKAIVAYTGNHLGGLAGNAFFGFYLGMVSAFGQLSGLPLDIRHIAFSSANFAYSWQAMGWSLPWQTIALSTAGVLLIGLVNLAVSFALAFYLALRASNLPAKEAMPLLKRTLLAMLLAPWRMFRQRNQA